MTWSVVTILKYSSVFLKGFIGYICSSVLVSWEPALWVSSAIAIGSIQGLLVKPCI